MELTILGSGTCVPSAEQASPAIFLKIGNSNILVDCGPGTLRQMAKAKIDYKELDYVFLTHFHPDHIADLIPLLQALNWTPEFTRKKHLIIAGPIGLLNFYNKLIELFPGSHPRLGTYGINIVQLFAQSYGDTGSFCVKTAKTPHSDESIAYRFEAKGKSVAISGDSGYDTKLIDFFRNTNALILECSFVEGFAKGHLNAAQCGEIASLAHPQKLILTHMYPPIAMMQRLSYARPFFENVVLAKDLMHIKV